MQNKLVLLIYNYYVVKMIMILAKLLELIILL